MTNNFDNTSYPPWERNTRQEKKGEGKMDIEAMHSNLIDFKNVMDRNEIPFVLIFGTLLGVIRDKELILTDTDVDMACFAQDHRKMLKVVKELEDKEFYSPNRNECPLNDHFFMRNMEKIEVWWFQKINKEYIYDDRVRYPSHYFDNLEEVSFLDIKWKVPSNPEEFLKLTYGNWQVPDKKGSYIL